MGMIARKAKMRLTFREEKPEVYKLRQLTYPQVTYDQLCGMIQIVGVNQAQTKAVVDALLTSLVHYMEIGHGVSLGTFGSFKPVFTSKVAQSYDDIDETIHGKTAKMKKKVRFFPGGQFQKMLKVMTVTNASETLDVPDPDPEP